MRRRLATCLICAGTLCVLAAMLLLGRNLREETQADAQAQQLRARVERAIEENLAAAQKMPQKTDDWDADQGQSVDGETYLGCLSIPALGLMLPVLADWQMQSLKRAPCRYSGTFRDNTLVIAAHNYAEHFGRLSSLQIGDAVYLTDMRGRLHAYTVQQLQILSAYEQTEMCSGDWDLTLFTCTYGGQNRLAVRCSLA